MKRRLWALILSLLLLCGCGGSALPPSSSPLFWKVTDGAGHQLYLMGSIHVGEEGLYPLPEEIEEAFDQSDALAVEMDIDQFSRDEEAQFAMLYAMQYSDGSKITDHISPELYDKIVAILTKQGIYSPLFDTFNVTYWMSLLDMVTTDKAGLSEEFGVDGHFLAKAKELGKKVIQVEGFDAQLELMVSAPKELELFMLQNSADNIAASPAAMRLLYESYYKGDEAGLTALVYSDESMDFTDQENGELLEKQYAEYQNMMYHHRNALMADAAEEYLAGGDTVFMVVGAAHMVGETGIVAALKERGCRVEQLVP